MQFNQAGLDLIKSFEGCQLKSYQDIVGVWTIGYGATGEGIGPGVEWTEAQADERLKSDIGKFSEEVDTLLTKELKDNQFSALVCFAYNVGIHNLKYSTLLRCCNSGDILGAAKQFLRWDHAGGEVIPGLTRRRQAEKQLFQS